MSFPAYPDYKDSGIVWLGEVPSHWEIIQTKRAFRRRKELNTGMICEDRLALTMNGVVPRSLDDVDGLQSSDYEGYQIFEAGDLAFKLIDLQNIKTSRVGMVSERGIMSPAYVRLKPVSNIIGQFGYWYFMALYWLQVFNNLGGGVRQTLGPEELLTVPFPLPSEAEQTAIATFLDRETAKIGALVAEQERLITLLKEKRQAVISHAVTKGLNPDVSMKDSGIEWLGEIPAHWKTQRAKNLFVKSSLPPPADAEVVTCFRDGQVTLRRNRREDGFTFAVLEAGYQGIRPGQLVLHSMDAFAGAIGVCDSDGKCSPEYIVCDPVDQRAMPDYYGRLLRLMALRGFILAICPSVRERAPRIRFPDFSDIILPIPPLGEQEAIVSALQASDAQTEKLISASSQAISLLQERRAALISAAVTGKIDVRGVVSQSNVVSIDRARPSILPPLRAVVGAYAIRELGPMGRMVVMKAGYLAEGHAGFGDLNGRYERYAAGPYDQSLIGAMERGAGEICAIVTKEPEDEGKPVTYVVPKGCQPPSDALSALVGEDRARRFLALLSLLKGIGRDGVEAAATLYAVWNDLLAASKVADDDAICNGVLNDWHPEKAKKFKRADLDHWLAWMRRNSLVPDGSAPRTDNQGSLFA